MYCKIYPEQGPLMFPADQPYAGEYFPGEVYEFDTLPPGFAECDQDGNLIPPPQPEQSIEPDPIPEETTPDTTTEEETQWQ